MKHNDKPSSILSDKVTPKTKANPYKKIASAIVDKAKPKKKGY